jgi:hypothetical protein
MNVFEFYECDWQHPAHAAPEGSFTGEELPSHRRDRGGLASVGAPSHSGA